MAKEESSKGGARKTEVRKGPATSAKQPRTQVRARPSTKVVETVVVKEKQGKGASPWVIAVSVIGVLLLLFLPIFPATKMVEKTETIMVPVTKEKEEQVTVDEAVKVFVGYIELKGSKVQKTGYRPETYVEIRYDVWGNPYYYTYTVEVPYTYYDTAPGKQIPIDPSLEIVEMQQIRNADGTWTLTLTAHDGTQTVYRDVEKFDLTKTGQARVKVTKTVKTPYTEQVPQQVTKQEEVQVRTSLLNLVLKNY